MKENLLKRSVRAMHTLAILVLMVGSFFVESRIVFAESEPLPVMVLVDTSALENNTVYEDTPKNLQKHITERIHEALGQNGLLWASDGKEATMVVKIRGTAPNSFSYSIKIELTYQRKPMEPAIEPFECPGCPENEVVDKILERVPEAARKLIEARENARIQSSATNNTANPTQNKEPCVPGEAPACEHQEIPRLPDLRKKYRPFYIAGGVVAGVGGGLVVAGAILLSKGEKETRDPEDPRLIHRKSFKTGGIAALTAVGATMAVTGVAILVGTHLRRKKESQKKLSVYPFFHPHALGMGLSTRF